MRWLAVSVIVASETFRKLRGYKGVQERVAALRGRGAKRKVA